MWNENDIYYDPEKSGLEIVGEVDFADSYEFDKFVVWREKETGRLGYAEDAGNSVASPFEDYTTDDLEWTDPWTISLKLQEAAAERRRWGYSFNPNDVVFLIDKVVNV